MPVPTTEATETAPKLSVADRIEDAVRHATHLSHEARLLTSMARDAGEDGIYAARRAIRRAQRRLETLQDLKDDAAQYVKRQPLKAVAIAFGVGVPIGMLLAWVGGRFRPQRGRP